MHKYNANFIENKITAQDGDDQRGDNTQQNAIDQLPTTSTSLLECRL